MNKHLSKKDIEKILNGTFKGNKIDAFGVTHYHYEDCNEKDLVDTSLKNVRVHKKCKQAFDIMQKDALQDGIKLEMISGYRSSKYQIEIFKCKFKDKNNPTEDELRKRLSVSAPSGFSEHHTGLAIDINSVEDEFAGTPEAIWLEKNAPKYGFELSFPRNNKQGLSYEPWHWRYVGDSECKKVFTQQI